jgi:nitroreductase
MPTAAFDFLARRRSHPAKFFDQTGPLPSRAELETILQAALRVPDHGKLEPWRLVVLSGKALAALGEIAADLAPDAEAAEKGRAIYKTSRLAVAVISAPKPFPKVPEVEQRASAHALCMNLVNAAEAAGWGACWLTGWPAHHPAWRARALGCTEGEEVAGLIHIGTPGPEAPDRPRPDLARIVEWRA